MRMTLAVQRPEVVRPDRLNAVQNFIRMEGRAVPSAALDLAPSSPIIEENQERNQSRQRQNREHKDFHTRPAVAPAYAG